MKSLIGQTIDNYHILEILGQGGMGVVYKAEDNALEKVVAIKVIDPFLARDDNFLRRFKTEAKAMAKLSNPNIVTVHALRETEMGFFMVMEFVEAQTLSEWIKERGAFSLEETLKIAKQLLGAIGFAHNAGVIHRDIKPSNILITKTGKVKVMDFGLAKVTRTHSPDSTVTHMRAGTLYYMSPEQVKGLKNVDVRSDLYSLGMTIYEMLAGRKPFDKTATEFSIQKQIVDGKIPSPLKFNSNIPKPIAKFIIKSIAQDPAKRFQRAEDMLAVLDAYEHPDKPKHELKIKKAGTPITLGKPLLYGLASAAFIILLILLYSFGVFGSGDSVSSGYLTITTSPPKAFVSINDEEKGESPIDEFEIKAGAVNIAIRKKGFTNLDTSFTIKDDEELNLAFKLEEVADEPIEEDQTEKNNETATAFGQIELTSDPSGALVYLSGKRVGVTPFSDNQLPEGRYNLVIKKDDYIEYKRAVRISKDKPAALNVNLQPSGKINIESNPGASTVYLNGSRLGNTPIRNKELPEGKVNLKISKPGFRDLDTVLSIRHKASTLLDVRLNESTGVLKILVRPYGSVFIGGKLKSENSIAQISENLTVGSHTVKASHPTLGTWQKQVEIIDGRSSEYVVDFNREFDVIVTSNPIGAQIVIDGILSGKYTPKLIKLRTGNHSISVQKDDHTLIGGEKLLVLEKDIKDDPIHFELQKK